jgi:hypothetical protein
MKHHGEELESVDALQVRVNELFGQIMPDQMQRVPEHLIEQLNEVISVNEDSV